MSARFFATLSTFLLIAAGARAQNQEPYPQPASKKGLQVQMVDDAIALGVKHAALNCTLSQLIEPAPKPDSIRWPFEGADYFFQSKSAANFDARIKQLSDAGVVVSLIIYNPIPANPAAAAILRHPRCDPNPPNHISAINTVTPDGARWFRATMDFLAARYSDPAAPHGRVWNYIIGNEVNSHWWWNNMGRVSMEEMARDYEHTMRLAEAAVRMRSANARIFLSLEHHWGIRYSPDATQSFPSKPFLEFFAREARAHGDFAWNVCFHPYPENLGDPRFWNDKTATPEDNSPRVTFKNLEVLTRFLRKPELLFNGQPRRVILGEQGFHCEESRPDGERDQAAAYALAFVKVARNPGIDAFILHRHVDNAGEGLNLGLWTHKPGTNSTPDRKRQMYEVFRVADTPDWKNAFEFALPVVGLKSWDEVESPR